MLTGSAELVVRDSEPRALVDITFRLIDQKQYGESDLAINGIQYDSRQIESGDLFVALAGGYYDGHDFAAMARDRGAAALLVQRKLDIELPQIVVADTRAALAIVAAEFYRHPSSDMDVVGVTGTDGKTTTSYLIDDMFQEAGKLTGVIGTVSVRIGDRTLDSDSRQTTPESLDVQRHLRAMVDAGVDAVILEATSHGLDLHRLDETRFTTAAVTSITSEHLEYHGTVNAYRRAKARLFEKVSEAGGTAIVNMDDEGAREMIGFAHGASIVTYGLDRRPVDIAASRVELGVERTRFRIHAFGAERDVETPLIGRFNVANALCATGAAMTHDISLEHCISALSKTTGVPGRMQSIRRGQPFAVIVDYAHTPDSVEKVLQLLRQLNPDGRLILVMGSAGERDITKRPLQGEIAARLADYTVFTTEDPRFEDADAIIADIAKGAIDSGAVEGREFARVTDRREAIEVALSSATPGDCVLLAGKGHERSIIWRLEKRPWDEAGVATEVLSSLGYEE